jgi:hypothetical protein
MRTVSKEHSCLRRLIENAKAPQPDLTKPIFVVGCPKSGTTLLGLLFSAHPQVGPKISLAGTYQSLQECMDAIYRDHALFDIVANEMEEKALWDSFFPLNGTDLRAGKELSIFKNPLTRRQVRDLIRALTKRFCEERYCSKQPTNTFRVHVLREIFPDAKFVAIHRDGRDVVSSWGRNVNRWERFGGYEKAIALFSRKWNEAVEHIELYRHDLDICTLRYEDLLERPGVELQKIFTFCELDDATSLFGGLQLANSKGKWKERIPPEYHAILQELTLGNRTKLGYFDS